MKEVTILGATMFSAGSSELLCAENVEVSSFAVDNH
jgi:hypothetical protein